MFDYLNDTQVTAYTGSMTVYYNGYMGKSFTNKTNMTNAAVYEGNNTVNVFDVSNYISAIGMNNHLVLMLQAME